MRKLLALPILVIAIATALVSAAGYDLDRDERLGGHTLSRHVGRTDGQLRDRLRRERGISAASTYDTQETAERVVGEALARFSSKVGDWKAKRGPRPNLALRFKGDDRAIGRSLERGRRAPAPCYDAVVVLRWDDRGGGAYVLTSYPELRR